MRNKFLILIFLFSFLIFIQSSLSYSTHNTHPVLTEEIAKFFNLKNQNYKFSQEEIEWLRQGSIREDEPARWINHFYDPIYKTGWSGKHFGTRTPEQGLSSGESLAPRPVLASIDWAVNQEYQSAYSMQYGNQTWQKALNSYLNGDKKSAFLALGHILHLIEDLSVPDHTRDDTHAGLYGDPGSPYEEYTKNYTNYNKLQIVEELINQNKNFLNFFSLQEYFYSLALYSNQNFFSEDTISNEEYKEPNMNIVGEKNELINERPHTYLFFNNIYLAKKDLSGSKISFTTDDNFFVMPSYRSHLFPQAVLTGASVINQFFKEVEFYKQNPQLLEPILLDQNQPILQTLKTAPKLVFIKGADMVDGLKTSAEVFLVKTKSQIKNLISKSEPSPAAVLQELPQNTPEALPEIPKTAEISPTDFANPNMVINPTSNILISNTPTSYVPTSNISNTPTYIYTLPPAKKPASSIFDQYGLTAIPSAAGAGGGGEVVQQPQQAQSQIQSQQTQSPVPDTTPPTINSFSVLECQNSISLQSCLIATTTVNLIWGSNDSDLDYYEFTYSANTSTTTATSKSLILQNNTAYSFSLRAKDKSNNWSATSTTSVEINTQPMVINEVAWMGTNQDWQNEWIELRNSSPNTINLDGWILEIVGKKEILIKNCLTSCQVNPGSYFLIERTDNNTLPDIPADLISSFSQGGLLNQGEILLLKDKSGNEIHKIDASNSWSAGDNNTKETMQKNENSWCTAIATPKAENNCQNRASQNPPPDTAPPNQPIIASPTSFNQTFTTTTINFQGIAEANSAITANYLLNNSTTTATTTVSNLGEWSLSLNLNQGTTTINFYAKDSSQNQSQATSVQLFIDSIGPTIDAFSITECSSGQNCQVATTTLHFLWNSSASDIDCYELSYGNNISTTTSAAMILTLQDNTAYSFSLRAKDRSGNWSATSTKTVSINIPADTTPPNAPIIASPSNFNQTSTSSQISFQGTAEASSTIQALYLFNNSTTTATTTASSTGNWSLTLSLNQATTTINFYAVDLANNTSSSTPAILFIDSLSPEISSFTIAQCSNSLSSDGCLTATTTLNLVWSSSNQDINYYELSYGSTVSTTTATSTALTLSDNSSYNFSLKAIDLSGNWSTTATTSVEISTLPIVINEIAWAGNSASSTDEWIELYNNASKNILLDGWILYSETDFSPYIKLSRTIPAKGYYLIERKTEDKISSQIFDNNNNPMADLLTSFSYGLNNSGETLVLSYASTTIDKTILCNFGPVRWCPGFDYKYRTMERIDPDISGENTINWSYNNQLIANGKDIAGNALSATPKARNSANSLISVNTPINQDITLAKNRSPYFIESALTLNQGKTLTINPGVVIKFKEGSGVSLNINGNLYVQGSQSEPVIFTSFRDDDCGLQNGCGDLNGDASSTSPVVGNNWKEVYLSPTSSSTINYAIFRYGGGYYSGDPSGRALLRVDQATSTIANSIFEYSYVNGIKLITSNSLISNNIFRYNNNSSQDSSGINVEGSSPTIINNNFENNKKGLYFINSFGRIENNVFNNNSQEAVLVSNGLSSFSTNSGSGNGYDEIILSGFQTQANSTTTLATNSLPYVLSGFSTVVSSSTLIIASPNQIKANSGGWIKINGRLIAEGNNATDIIFSSNTTSPAKGDWYGLRAENGYLNLKGTTIKYAGKNVFGGNSGGLVLENSTAIIKNSAFDYNKNSAIYMTNSSLNLDTVSFNNNDTALSSPDWPAGSSVNYSNMTFTNNTATSSPDSVFSP